MTAPRTSRRIERIRDALAAAASNRNLHISSIDIDALTAAVVEIEGKSRYFPAHPGSPLNTREVQIIAGAARGHTNAQIAHGLGLSPLTVKAHLTRISKRINCGDRAGMVGIAYRRGWLLHLPIEPRQLDPLKPQWRPVLDGMAFGLSNAAIAKRLLIAEDSVKSRARGLFIALGASNRAHAVAIAYQHGLLTIPTQHDRSAAA